jgi:hypothetical protein
VLRALGAGAIACALVAAGAWLQHLRETRYTPPPDVQASLYLPGPALKHLTAGYNAVAADLYWIRTIQYYGDLKLRLENSGAPASPDPADAPADRNGTAFPLLYPLLDITTTLDPAFNIAYRFGAIFLAEAYPRGAGRPDQAIALLERGLRHRPDKWEYMQDIGFVHYWWRHDYEAAAGWFARAADVPGAPWFIRSLAATTLAEGGDHESSRAMWQSIRETADNDWLRSEADRRLAQLDALAFIASLQQRIDSFVQQTGQTPRSWDPIVRAGLLPGVPLDPNRVPYEIDAEGRAVLSARSPLFPLPDEPRHLGAPPS